MNTAKQIKSNIQYLLTKVERITTHNGKDIFHEHVKEALVKDGWKITDDSLCVAF